jgi:hypothetical protein
MGILLDPLPALLIAGGLMAFAVYVFGRVRADCRAQGALTKPVAALRRTPRYLGISKSG